MIRALICALDGVPSPPSAPPREYVVGQRVDARSDGVHVIALAEVTPRSARELIPGRSLTFVCVDNHFTRKVIGESVARRSMRDVVLISGGNDGVENGLDGTYGNVIVHARREGRDLTNPLTTFHPEIARPTDKPPGAAGCAALAPSAPQLLITNFAVASAMLVAFYAWLTSQLSFEELYLDVAQARMRPVSRKVGA